MAKSTQYSTLKSHPLHTLSTPVSKESWMLPEELSDSTLATKTSGPKALQASLAGP
jgi:hypothetical protein